MLLARVGRAPELLEHLVQLRAVPAPEGGAVGCQRPDGLVILAAEHRVVEGVRRGTGNAIRYGRVKCAPLQPIEVRAEFERAHAGVDTKGSEGLRHDLAGGDPVRPAGRNADVIRDIVPVGDCQITALSVVTHARELLLLCTQDVYP